MALYLISYDIPTKDKDEYQELWSWLEEKRAIRVLFSQWLLNGQDAASLDIAKEVSKMLRNNDRLLVQEVTNNTAWLSLKISDDAMVKLLEGVRQ